MKIFQYSCREGEGVDLRQANAVLRHRPDAIIFEAPSEGRTASSAFNKFKPGRKPEALFNAVQKEHRKTAKRYPWVLSDVRTYDNIRKLWKKGHDIKLFNVDGPPELLRVDLKKFSARGEPGPERRGTHLLWWVRIYLREKIMTKYIQQILEQEGSKKDAIILVFLQSFHWRNVKFLLTDPPKKAIWRYYFGKFRTIDTKNIAAVLRDENDTLFKHWKKSADFA